MILSPDWADILCLPAEGVPDFPGHTEVVTHCSRMPTEAEIRRHLAPLAGYKPCGVGGELLEWTGAPAMSFVSWNPLRDANQALALLADQQWRLDKVRAGTWCTLYGSGDAATVTFASTVCEAICLAVAKAKKELANEKDDLDM